MSTPGRDRGRKADMGKRKCGLFVRYSVICRVEGKQYGVYDVVAERWVRVYSGPRAEGAAERRARKLNGA